VTIPSEKLAGRPQIHPAALAEAQAAVDWYAARSKRAAEAFLNELDHTMQQLSEHPEQSSPFDFGTRRAVLRKFPFLVIFRETATSVEVIAVAHGRRRPGYWRATVSDDRRRARLRGKVVR
jgi:plasmid stabilization system protein ParE